MSTPLHCDRRICPSCSTELTRVRGRQRLLLWCWKCERYWKAGVKSEADTDA